MSIRSMISVVYIRTACNVCSDNSPAVLVPRSFTISMNRMPENLTADTCPNRKLVNPHPRHKMGVDSVIDDWRNGYGGIYYIPIFLLQQCLRHSVRVATNHAQSSTPSRFAAAERSKHPYWRCIPPTPQTTPAKEEGKSLGRVDLTG